VIKSYMLAHKETWTSHSVLVEDMSGSMRCDDVNGSRCRSDGVWLVLAKEYVKVPLENKTRSHTDLVSIIAMHETAEIVIMSEPMSWVLYNKLLDKREFSTIKPKGPGNYMPALAAAKELLMMNESGTCALSLLFFSDGKPSDSGNFTQCIGTVASQFGRRLSISCIGMAGDGEDFSVLREMASEAELYGCVSSFGKPSLDTDSLSILVSDLTSSLTTSMTEIKDTSSGKRRTIRSATREKRGTDEGGFVTGDWWVYSNKNVLVFHDWIFKKKDFVEVLDRRCRTCWVDTKTNGIMCLFCKGVLFCSKSCMDMENDCDEPHDCFGIRQQVKCGDIVAKSYDIPSYSVATKKNIFGEGAERFVRKFNFLADDLHTFIGPKMVAKESKYVEESETFVHRFEYQKKFIMTQATASMMAKKFNRSIVSLNIKFSEVHPTRFKNLPRIQFLDPMLIQVDDNNSGISCYLVEPMLEGTYEKFNNNKGEHSSGANISSAFRNLKGLDGAPDNDLGVILEGSESEEESSDSDDEDDIGDHDDIEGHRTFLPQPMHLNDKDIPQAFSHFTYVKSRRRYIVVDLQGVFSKNPDGRKLYKLTDPAIHRNRRRGGKSKFGRTDHGREGIKAFFESHQCCDTCRILGLHSQLWPH